MAMYQEIDANLIERAKDGYFDVIMHGCNCFCTMGSGIAVPMKNTFEVDKYDLELPHFKGDMNKLGQIDYQFNEDYGLYVVNGYTQYDYNRKKDPEAVMLDDEALILCLKKLNHTFKSKKKHTHIGLPLIGCGRAGGSWNIVQQYFQQYLKDVKVTVVHYNEKL